MPTTPKLIAQVAIFRAYNRRCFYCQELLQFRDLELDHIIPRSRRSDQKYLLGLFDRIGLPRDFDLESPRNLVPTHGSCNRRKSDLDFEEPTLRFYLGLTQKQLPRIKREIQDFTLELKNDSLWALIEDKIENGDVSIDEIVSYLSTRRVDTSSDSYDALIVGFSAIIDEIPVDALPLKMNVIPTYPYLCDYLEGDLLNKICAKWSGLFVPCEESARDGETLCVRLATRVSDLDQYLTAVPSWWTLTEIVRYSEIYGSRPDSQFLELLQEAADRAAYAS